MTVAGTGWLTYGSKGADAHAAGHSIHPHTLALTRNFSLLLALRYLKPKRTFVSVITLISVLGVSLGVTVLMVVISVMRGFEAEIKETMLGFEAHIELFSYQGPRWEPVEDDWDAPMPDAGPSPLGGVPGVDIDPAALVEAVALTATAGGDPLPTVMVVAEPGEADVPAAAPGDSAPEPAGLTPPPLAADDLPPAAPRNGGWIDDDHPEDDWRQLIERLQEQPNVVSATPFVSGLVFLEFEGEPTASGMLAVDPDAGGRLERMHELIEDGAVDLDGDHIVIGLALARKLGLWVGDTVTIYAPSNIRELVQAVRRLDEAEEDERDSVLEGIRELVLPLDVEVTGVFDSIRYGEVVLLPLYVAQELMGLEDDVHGIELMTTDAYRADVFQRELHEAGLVPPLWRSQAWMDKHANFFATIRMERSMMYFVLFMVVVVAAFCVMNTMITVTVQKRREVGIITALGARLRQIIWVFLAQGMVVGVFGMVGGVCLGLVVIHFRNDLRRLIHDQTGFELFDSTIYGLIEIPAKVEWGDLLFIGGGSFILCSVAALIPAYMAARVDPARALRNE